MKPRALVLQARGTNRDFDVFDALLLAGATPECVPLNSLQKDKKRFVDYEMLVIAGGFSYADALGAGKLLALDLTTYFGDEINAFVEAKKPVIGICNGFQALIKSGILPGIVSQTDSTSKTAQSLTLTFNESGHFECRWVSIQPMSQTCVWTRSLSELIQCPVAHGEGNLQVSDANVINRLVMHDQIALIYVNSVGDPAAGDYPVNPNGSVLDIAGICNEQGNVLGLMPHPENHIYPYQHPKRTRGASGFDGLALFKAGVGYAANL